ncbi:CidA/LrgA family protein [Streptococcus sobrinus]|uniref:CidA/LrgA family protein n=1 Tax=Streptococcus sobrinus TaxID=1310 RepID=UPI0002FC4CFA|nr:CidA/LrgA family protein [Streptococcus sobrinus]
MKDNQETTEKKSAPIFIQMSIYAGILLVSQLISDLLPKSLPIPSTVIGLILMYVLLCSHLIKLEWVDSLASLLISMIGFMFVPSGISLAANLNIMKAKGLQLVTVICLSTILMLIVVTYVTSIILSFANNNTKSLGKKLKFHHVEKLIKKG